MPTLSILEGELARSGTKAVQSTPRIQKMWKPSKVKPDNDLAPDLNMLLCDQGHNLKGWFLFKIPLSKQQ